MSATCQTSLVQEIARTTSFALDMAIIELESGDTEMSLDTLKTLSNLLLEIADPKTGE